MAETCEQAKTLRRSYLAQMDWLEKMSKRYDQKRCNKCGIWHIWKRPPKPNAKKGN